MNSSILKLLDAYGRGEITNMSQIFAAEKEQYMKDEIIVDGVKYKRVEEEVRLDFSKFVLSVDLNGISLTYESEGREWYILKITKDGKLCRYACLNNGLGFKIDSDGMIMVRDEL